MQYAPAAVMLGMKVAGVQSRSSWGRMLVSDAFSALLMGGVVNTLKQTTNVERPDGSNKHSFPSGHTEQTGPVGTWPYFRKINLDIFTKTANFRFFRQQKFR